MEAISCNLLLNLLFVSRLITIKNRTSPVDALCYIEERYKMGDDGSIVVAGIEVICYAPKPDKSIAEACSICYSIDHLDRTEPPDFYSEFREDLQLLIEEAKYLTTRYNLEGDRS